MCFKGGSGCYFLNFFSIILAVMNAHPISPPTQGVHHLESFTYLSPSLPSYQHNGFYNQGLPYLPEPKSMEHQASNTHPTSEVEVLSLKAPLCPLCKGQKYGFTAYFHNPKIFSEPPHDLLPLVEKSYALKNRLKSLLVTYVMREREHDGFKEAEKEVLLWSRMVEELLGEIVTSAVVVELGLRPLEEVRKWTREMTRQIRQSLVGGQKLEMPKGRLQALLVEFRKLWEGVWLQSLLDRNCEGSLQNNYQD
jgi:hypothetical protein